ncbi:copper transporter 5.1 [Tripterygium wilfordii]|uniref:Copper transport protein n=1 Tax=Tripterygium wilfordii TaxID=458696 RepID=A0A7J7BWC9_TRIWF|nr:copper transporter 5.1-like [Tripterygium wilfordii]KAF5726128.1 copper transporter 5.1 [Tripterygium wilfordii]
MMHMTFYWSRYVTILIDSWRTSTWLGYFLSLLACLIVGIFYQYLEDLRVRLKLLAASASKKSSSADALQIQVPLLRSSVAAGKLSAARVAGAALFGVNSAIGYMLMLAVMSFNGGVLVAVCLGLAIGYLVFRSGDEEAIVLEDNACACA